MAKSEKQLTRQEVASLVYHDLFNYPLTISELKKWTVGTPVELKHLPQYHKNHTFYYLKGRDKIVKIRQQRIKHSLSKMKIAHTAARIVGLVPGVLFIGLTGSLAMNNADKGSDIDFLIITRKGRLWITRGVVLVVLKSLGLYRGSREKDKICTNIWMEEDDLAWPERQRNIFTAHEILQTKPLLDKGALFGRYLGSNKWAITYWPKVHQLSRDKKTPNPRSPDVLFTVFEKWAYRLQLIYMKRKITREVLLPNRAIFHPRDLTTPVMRHLRKLGFVEKEL